MHTVQNEKADPFQQKKHLIGDIEFKTSLYRIILVEDDFDDQFLTKKHLMQSKNVGDVLCFSNGRDLIRYLHDQHQKHSDFLTMVPLIIILDLDMPLLNGFEVLQEIKADAFLKDIPVAVVSGTDSRWEVEKALFLGADEVFKKPLNVASLNVFFRNRGHSGFWENHLWKKIRHLCNKYWHKSYLNS